MVCEVCGLFESVLGNIFYLRRVFVFMFRMNVLKLYWFYKDFILVFWMFVDIVRVKYFLLKEYGLSSVVLLDLVIFSLIEKRVWCSFLYLSKSIYIMFFRIIVEESRVCIFLSVVGRGVVF